MTGHHLILGEITDILTGEILEDTHDERYRQKLARLLIHNKGYTASEVIPRNELIVRAGEKQAVIRVDLIVNLSEKIGMIIRYGPGSLVTRHRPALAMSRLVSSYRVPVAVVTNGEDVDVLNALSGKLMGTGFDAIPHRARLKDIMAESDFSPVSKKQAEMESRIVYCYEIDGSCPCDTTICTL